MKFALTTLGCKINQFDAGRLSEALAAGGATPARDGEPADVYIIQTCTVTGRSDYQCRQAIRKAVREKPDGGRVVVTGCYAQTSPAEILKIPGVDMVIPNAERDALPALLLGGSGIVNGGVLRASAQRGRSRAFLKVQEGCDNTCSYCIVPKARGISRSAEPGGVLEKARGLVEAGFHEIVLTGVHLGSYGRDLPGGYTLSGVVGGLLGIEGIGRLRLSSVEPMEFDEVLMGLISTHARENGRICRHFHVPLQSADDAVLESMQRDYRWEDYLTVVNALSLNAPGACIGADIIVGYPAEDDKSFEAVYDRIEASPINHMHVFSYSPRPGTKAYGMGDPVPGDVKRKRSAALRQLAARKSREFRLGLIGRNLRVVVEEKDWKYSGLTDNYAKVSFSGNGLRQGLAVDVEICGMEDGELVGVVA